MALVTIASTASMDVHGAQYVASVGPLEAGEDLLAVSPCYIKSDGLVYMSVSTTTVSGFVDYVGFCPKAVASGAIVDLFMEGARFDYSTGMTPGQKLWIGATKGRLDTAQAGDSDEPVAVAINATDIVVIE